ncbi:antibiotic biosynthesis monooxygenase family protein [Streptomyces sp. NPDC037389]|uniref:antibiotic biosynthesis monooxygenase family protein n=1 Tax=Streptomyces sp. NPDC037389 TaxID=3155369 RepID=UPI0033CEF8A5
MPDHHPGAAAAEPRPRPVTFVNRFTVHAAPEEFEAAFARTAEYMARQPGFLRHTLARHVDRPGHYVNIAEWEDAASFEAAVAHPGFRPHAAGLRALSSSEPDLYETRRTRTADRPAPAPGPAAGPGEPS